MYTHLRVIVDLELFLVLIAFPLIQKRWFDTVQRVEILIRVLRQGGFNRVAERALSRGYFFFESELVFCNAHNGVQSKSCYIFSIALHHLIGKTVLC
jgi:hypothetical protein